MYYELPTDLLCSISRNYLDWLTLMPWDKFTEETFDLQHARTILDKDHFGMKDVKAGPVAECTRGLSLFC